MIKRITIGSGMAVALASCLVAVIAWSPLPDFNADAAIKAAQSYDVEVIRDEYGVPHIFGARDQDVAFGLGYAHMEDDWQTIEMVVLMARGALARRDGAEAAPTDYLVRMFGVQKAVAERYETDLSPKMRAVLEGYAAGINLYAADHPDRVNPLALPVSAQDVVAGFVFRAPFFYGLERVLKDLSQADPEQTAFNDAIRTALHLKAGAHLGSNAMAVAPGRSEDGHTRLMVNSHQPYTGPVAWYEAHLQSDEGWAANGALFPGSPVMLVGHNRDLGWAHTVNEPDLVDIYRLEVDDVDDPVRYRYDGEWRALERDTAHLQVRLWGPFSWTFKEPLYRSVHGPVLKTPKGVFAIAFAGEGDVRAVEQWYRMNKAESLTGWMDAMAMMAVPSLNTVYADKAGNIAFVYNARIPDRAPGADYEGILPGNDPHLVWRGVRPFSEVPKIVNPQSGYLVSANSTPLRASDVADDLKESDFPPDLGIERHLTNRALRALALFGKDTSISAEEFLRYKFDKAYAPGSNMSRFVRYISGRDFRDQPKLLEAQQLLLDWDGTAELESEGAALAILGSLKAVHSFEFKGWDMDPVEAFEETVDALHKHYGTVHVPWSKINKVYRGDQEASLGGGPDTLRAVYGGNSLAEDGTLHGMAGDSYIQLVDWDENGQVKAWAVHQFGSATLDERSPHYGDQLSLFAAERLRPVDQTMPSLASKASSRYRLPRR
ncbi:penicillin amidase [Iodidimonas muriae]|uniref:Penicillin amidase n=1 Tax=Iodidimonas muriae TaxID=261467 RepID=A0ABQ2L5K8_9PROT|nr:acylase [Iodidimonas muriae]GGO04359.1 penicillin amidase [Iodidimonas muriae]